jgi:hypothetical protein
MIETIEADFRNHAQPKIYFAEVTNFDETKLLPTKAATKTIEAN